MLLDEARQANRTREKIRQNLAEFGPSFLEGHTFTEAGEILDVLYPQQSSLYRKELVAKALGYSLDIGNTGKDVFLDRRTGKTLRVSFTGQPRRFVIKQTEPKDIQDGVIALSQADDGSLLVLELTPQQYQKEYSAVNSVSHAGSRMKDVIIGIDTEDYLVTRLRL